MQLNTHPKTKAQNVDHPNASLSLIKESTRACNRLITAPRHAQPPYEPGPPTSDSAKGEIGWWPDQVSGTRLGATDLLLPRSKSSTPPKVGSS